MKTVSLRSNDCLIGFPMDSERFYVPTRQQTPFAKYLLLSFLPFFRNINFLPQYIQYFDIHISNRQWTYNISRINILVVLKASLRFYICTASFAILTASINLRTLFSCILKLYENVILSSSEPPYSLLNLI